MVGSDPEIVQIGDVLNSSQWDGGEHPCEGRIFPSPCPRLFRVAGFPNGALIALETVGQRPQVVGVDMRQWYGMLFYEFSSGNLRSQNLPLGLTQEPVALHAIQRERV